VLAHRLLPATRTGREPAEILAGILESVPVPD
jgi:hypothetical protein